MPKIKTKLKDKQLEAQMQGTEDDKAFKFLLSSIIQVLDLTVSDTVDGDTIIIVTDRKDEKLEDNETEKRN